MFRGRANEHFGRRYGRVLLISLLLSATFFVLVAMYAPPYSPQPYRLRDTPTTVVNIAPNIALHKAPPRIPRPPIPDDVIENPEAPDVPFPPTSYPVGNPPLLDPLEGPEDYIGWDKDPELVRQVAPEYPDLARQAEAEGRVKLLITIDETGRVVDAEILESEVLVSMERAAIEAARKWLFKPAYQRDVPVRCTIVISFNFSLR